MESMALQDSLPARRSIQAAVGCLAAQAVLARTVNMETEAHLGEAMQNFLMGHPLGETIYLWAKVKLCMTVP